MNSEFQVSVVTDETRQDVAVLRIASAARNSVTQCYGERVQVNCQALGDLNRKLIEKLRLHQIINTRVTVTLQFQGDKTVTFNSVDRLQQYDLKTGALTQAVVMKWSFVFDVEGDGQEHLHSIYVRLSERPNPGLLLQRVLSGHAEDELDHSEAFAPVVCKVDFFDSRFSTELLSVVTEWVKALPKAEATFGLVNWLRKHEDPIFSFIHGMLPAIAVLGYAGLWLGVVPPVVSNSVRIAAAWILGGAVLFLFSRYVASRINSLLSRHLQRITTVPVFQMTSGDGQRMTKYLAKSHNSMFKLGATGLVLGLFKGIGLYLATYVIRAFAP